ncbi:universal stress protein [Desulfobacter postgatei]|uniref:Universal stress protein UspA-like protein n=2 Tax=Desulfobacter TaxID=2289 RepID=I5B3J2_9BACT|nr:universal stress protein [Desulfobacter postgatei]EIM64055.1 universal stress protein UspA-like protein [Desulfobacter postgatei 2ac9]
MYRYKKLMVCLNLDEHDRYLVKYSGFISRMTRSEEVLFVYVYDSFDIPEEIRKIYPQLYSPPEAMVKKQMQKIVAEHFNGHEETAVLFKSMEGPQLGMLISCTKNYDIDLLIVGHNPDDSAGFNWLAEKLARKAFCSLLVIPSNTTAYFDKILVAVDFSDYSLNALDVASAFAKAANLDHLYILNNYQVPTEHHKTGKTYEEFAYIMLENAKSRLRIALSKVDLKSLDIKPIFKKDKNIVSSIRNFSESLGDALIVVGARGRSGNIAAILLGSITEGLIRTTHKPLLAVKEKGQGLNILEAFTSQ